LEGLLTYSVSYGDFVTKHEVLATLHNDSLEHSVVALAASRDRHQKAIEVLEARSLRGEEQPNLVLARAQLLDVTRQLAEKQKQLDSLRILAPTDGVVFPPPDTPSARTSPSHLGTWAGAPFDDLNERCFVHAGTPLCLVGDAQAAAVTIRVAPADIGLVKPGQSVQFECEQRPWQTWTGTVEDISFVETMFRPHDKSSQDNSFVPKTFASEDELVYLVRASVAWPDDQIRLRGNGQARIRASSLSLASRLWRFINQISRR
jgi:multidrug efflux pump subunit AcrA (membrane-fusion protein)